MQSPDVQGWITQGDKLFDTVLRDERCRPLLEAIQDTSDPSDDEESAVIMRRYPLLALRMATDSLISGDFEGYWSRVGRLVAGQTMAQTSMQESEHEKEKRKSKGDTILSSSSLLDSQWHEEHALLRDCLLGHLGGADAPSLFDDSTGPLNAEWYSSLMRILHVNSMDCSGHVCLFATASLLNHSCDSNLLQLDSFVHNPLSSTDESQLGSLPMDDTRTTKKTTMEELGARIPLPAFVKSDVSLPWVKFVTERRVEAGEELTISYTGEM